MNNFIKLGIISFIFLASFLMISLSSAQSADPTGNAPIMVAAQEATIPLATNAVTGASETESPYKLRLKAGALFLHREDNDSRTVVILDGSRTINANDLDLGWATGTDISLMGQYKKEFGAELRYFGLQDWSESKSAESLNVGIPYHSPTTFFFISNQEMHISADYNSKVNNAEFNLHWWPCANDRYHLLMGVRWIRLNERLDFNLVNIVGSLLDHNNVTADNKLWGGQLGIEGILLGNQKQGFSVDVSVKAGYYNNNFSSSMHDSFWSQFGYGANVSKDHGTFAGEMGIGAQYAFTRNIALGTRYQLFWLDSVGLAPEQMRTLHPSTGGGSADWDSVLYQGGWVGLTVSF